MAWLIPTPIHHPLHVAGYYLNPKYFYSKPTIENDPILVEGYYLNPKYFYSKPTIENDPILVEAKWWKTYGAQTPLLQLLAIKVLSLTCSSSRCERNWSTFEHIHCKKISRLEHKRLEDLVFIKYNQDLKERYDCRDVIDPIVLNDDNDYINEFEVGDLEEDGELVEELVYAGDNLTWIDVANELVVYTRQATKEKAAASAYRAIAQEAISKEVVVEEDVE
uniref:Uncharacterized protein LOC101512383 n=1 Tax=Cicer arietinum TaxID=3827 RepID=A0A1S2Z1N1_CICAR|nr:uncharacterized protein LOC101512383 [Cicer arietinum]